MPPRTLYEYFTSRGQSLPSIPQRRSTYGLGSDYVGTAEQNNALLARLLGNQSGISPTVMASANGAQTAGRLENDLNREAQTVNESRYNYEQNARTMAANAPPEYPPEVTAEMLGTEAVADRDIRKINEQAAQDEKDINDYYQQMAVFASEENQMALSSLRNDWQERRKEMERKNKFNQALFQKGEIASGASRYAPEISQAFLQDEERQSQQRMAKIDAEYSQALSKAQLAIRKGDYVDAYNQKIKIAAIKERALNEVANIQEQARKINDKLREENRLAENSYLVSNFLEQGLTDRNEIIQAMYKAGKKITAKELDEMATSLMPEVKEKDKPFEKLSANLQDYYALKENYPEALPESVTKLPDNQQPWAYVRYVSSLTRAPGKPKEKKAFTLNATSRQKLLGVGVSLSQIQAIEEYLATYGFDQQLQDSLGGAAPILQSVLSGNDEGGDSGGDDEDMSFLD